MQKFNQHKQIFQANPEMQKLYPFYQGFYMSFEWFQREVVYTVWLYNQKEHEKMLGNTIYLNGIGFAKGKVSQTLSEIAFKIHQSKNCCLDNSELANLRSYGIRYVKQYFDIINSSTSMAAELNKFKEEYNKYALACHLMESDIDSFISNPNATETQKNAIRNEKAKLYSISKLSVISKNVDKIINDNRQPELTF